MSKGKKDNIPTLDLHGYPAGDVFDAVDAFLRKHSDKERVRIIPGKGSGKVMAQVKDYLTRANYPSSYEKSEKGVANEGSLIVYTG
jgi:dsDNA-specific endonuclease/ATPase MutS2